jgi:GcrA cell cycle regulator
MPQVSPSVAADQSVRAGWSEQAVRRLEALWAQPDLSATAIGRELGVSRNAVLGKAHRLGLPSRQHDVAARVKAAARRSRRRRASAGAPAFCVERQPCERDHPAWPGEVQFLERLPAHACHWPIGDPQESGFSFCGRPAGERIYCDHHWAIGHRRQAQARSRAGGANVGRA